MLPAPYPDFATIQARHVATRRERALAAMREAAAVAALHGARVVVFGSLAEGRFHRASDLDLALDGPAEALDEATAAVFEAVAGHGLEAGIVRLDRADGRLLDRIRRHGRDPADLG